MFRLGKRDPSESRKMPKRFLKLICVNKLEESLGVKASTTWEKQMNSLLHSDSQSVVGCAWQGEYDMYGMVDMTCMVWCAWSDGYDM